MRIGETNQGFGLSVHVDGARTDGAQSASGKKSFRMGANLQTQNAIAEKKEKARSQAMKLIKDVFASDLKVSEELAARKQRVTELQEESGEAQRSIKELEQRKEQLKETYGVEDDSQEQQDLLLLEKKREKGALSLTEGERERVRELEAGGMTEYQKRCLEIDEYMTPYKDKIEENERQIISDNSVIRETKLEKLKHRPMLEAAQAGEAIMQAASDEAVSQLYAEGKEYLDKKAEEEREAAKEQKEKEEEQEERIESVREKKEQIEEMVEQTREKVREQEAPEPVDLEEPTEVFLELHQAREDVQEEVRKILAKLGLSEEDLKGAVVDENL